jgi:hypothetical protein
MSPEQARPALCLPRVDDFVNHRVVLILRAALDRLEDESGQDFDRGRVEPQPAALGQGQARVLALGPGRERGRQGLAAETDQGDSMNPSLLHTTGVLGRFRAAGPVALPTAR